MPKRPTEKIEEAIDEVIDEALDTLVKTVEMVNPLSLLKPKTKVQVGGVPGLTPQQIAEQLKDNREPADVSVIDFGSRRTERNDNIEDPTAYIKQGRPDWADVRWINVNGVNDPDVLTCLAEHYHLHPLAMEDVVNASSRPKVETYGQPEIGRPRYFLTTRMLYLEEESRTLIAEQISLFAGPHTIITFQQRSGDVWEPVRERIKNPASRFHQSGPGYLLYALLDAVIDALFPLLEGYADRITLIEDRILEDEMSGDNTVIQDIYRLKRELMLLRKEAAPMRDLVRSITDQDTVLMDDQTRIFMRDVVEHAAAAMELLDTYRELTQGLADAWVNMASHRMNEVMKVLTVVAALFIPISFLAGVFGMNFDDIPFLNHPGAFGFFCFTCIGIVVFMLIWFKRRGWL